MAQSDAGSKPKILVVEDDSDSNEMLQRLLRGDGYAVTATYSGREALAAFRDADVVLLAIQLPDADGFEVCRQIKADEKGRYIPILFLTSAHEEQDNMVKGLDAGGDDYLTRPFRTEELLARVRALLRVRRAELELKRRGEVLATLNAIIRVISGSLDLDEILKSALDSTLSIMEADAGEVFLLDGDQQELILKAQRGLPSTFLHLESAIPMGECLCGRAAQSAQAVLVADVMRHPGREGAACQRAGFHSLACLPLVGRDGVLGLLNVHSHRRREFSAQDEELLVAIGREIGMAVEKADLFQRTERERAALDSVMRSIVDGLILVDADGVVTYWNPQARRFLGISAAEVVGQPVAALRVRIARQTVEPEQTLRRLEQALEARASLPTVEFELARPRPRAIQARLFPIRSVQGQKTDGYGVSMRDITREKELDEIKTQLLSTVSHELRTPLASIKGFATTLLRQDVQWDEATQREFLQIIDEESDRLTELIANLLEMSKIEAGALRIEPEPTQLRPLIREAVDEAKMRTETHWFITDLPAELPLVVADPRRIRQVLRNLLENAIKYSPDGGQISVRCHVEEDQLRVSVADQGIGIPTEYLDKVFERFFQVDAALTRRAGGSGLGLSISRGIVRAHGGRIWAESGSGPGSTVHFSLPLADGAACAG